MAKQELTEMYRNFLAEEGYLPRIDEDGDLSFKCEGKTYLILVDGDDEEFFQLVLPNFWSIDSEEERARAVDAALQATAGTKVAKVFLVRDNVWAVIELFCSPPEAFRRVFTRALGAVRAGAHNFAERMQA